MLQVGGRLACAASRIVGGRTLGYHHICAEDGRPLPAYAQQAQERLAQHGREALNDILAEFDEARRASPEKVTHEMWETVLASLVTCGEAAEAVNYYDEAVAAGFFQGPEYSPFVEEDVFMDQWSSAGDFKSYAVWATRAYHQLRRRQLLAPPSRVPPAPSNADGASPRRFVDTLLRSFCYTVEDLLGARLPDDRVESAVAGLLASPLFAAVVAGDATFAQLPAADRAAFVAAAAKNDQLAGLLRASLAALGVRPSDAAYPDACAAAADISRQLCTGLHPDQAGGRYDAVDVDALPPADQLARELADYIKTAVPDSDPAKQRLLANSPAWTAGMLSLLRDPRYATPLKNESRLVYANLDQDAEAASAQLEHRHQLDEAERRHRHFVGLPAAEQQRLVADLDAQERQHLSLLDSHAVPVVELLKAHLPADRSVDDEPRELWERRWAFISAEADRYAAAHFRFNGTTEVDRITNFVKTFHAPATRRQHRLHFAKALVELFGYKPLDWFVAASFGIAPPGYFQSPAAASPEHDAFKRSLEACASQEEAVRFLRNYIEAHP